MPDGGVFAEVRLRRSLQSGPDFHQEPPLHTAFNGLPDELFVREGSTAYGGRENSQVFGMHVGEHGPVVRSGLGGIADDFQVIEGAAAALPFGIRLTQVVGDGARQTALVRELQARESAGVRASR